MVEMAEDRDNALEIVRRKGSFVDRSHVILKVLDVSGAGQDDPTIG